MTPPSGLPLLGPMTIATSKAALQPLFIRTIPDQEIYNSRLHEEFALIDRNNFTAVFLQVRRILELTADIPHIIRGSAGSSLVCFLLGITHIDPVLHGLELARFMNSKRMDMPDIDMDFPYNRRAEVFAKIEAAWPKQVARVSNHIHWHSKSAMRAAAREAGVPAAALKRGWKLDKVVADPATRSAIFNRAASLNGQIRTHSLHCGGIVIFEEEEEVPPDLLLETGPEKPVQLRLDKDETEEAGLIKIDILSNRGLAVLADLSPTSLTAYPATSAAITELFRSGNNIGITFAESRGMRKILAVMAPATVTEVAMALALIRPAAAGNGHKRLFLEEWTAGIWTPDGSEHRILFDDDAINTIRDLLRCSDAEADVWRKAFAKGRKEKEAEFAALMSRTGYDPTYIALTIDNLKQLQLYSFCKSHALSYAQLVWALAYWKLRSPHEFWIAALNHCNSEYRDWVHKREARSSGLLLSRARPPYELGTRKGQPAVIPVETAEQQVLLPDENPRQMLCDLKNHGTWFGPDFLPGCRLWDHQTLLNKKGAIRVRFCGPIASGRVTNIDPTKTLTVICIGVGNQHYVDLVVEGKRSDLLNHFAVAGVGLLSSRGPLETITVERISGVSMASLLTEKKL
jgi:DNA polymerase III alpha subunit